MTQVKFGHASILSKALPGKTKKWKRVDSDDYQGQASSFPIIFGLLCFVCFFLCLVVVFLGTPSILGCVFGLFVCLFACLLACLLACLFVCLFVCLLVCSCFVDFYYGIKITHEITIIGTRRENATKSKKSLCGFT